MKKVRIAAAVVNAKAGEVAENLAQMANRVAEARQMGVHIICFPEMNITGYGLGAQIQNAAQTIPGPITAAVEHMARENSLVILAGMAEKEASGRIFATHVVAGDGRLEKYRKVHLAPLEKQFFAAGDAAPVFNAQGLCFGIQLCYDAHFPELTTRMALNGAEAIFLPHASPRGTAKEKEQSWMRHLPARAFDNGVYVVACNQQGPNSAGLCFPGIALAIGPDGRVQGRACEDREGLLLAELDPEALSSVRRHRMRYFLPHRRPEVYT